MPYKNEIHNIWQTFKDFSENVSENISTNAVFCQAKNSLRRSSSVPPTTKQRDGTRSRKSMSFRQHLSSNGDRNDECESLKTSLYSHMSSVPPESNGNEVFVETAIPKHVLTQEDYDVFFENLISDAIPEYLRHTYLDQSINRICVGVTKGFTGDAELYIQHAFPEIYLTGCVLVHEVGELNFGAIKKAHLAANEVITEENRVFKTDPGLKLKNVEAGKEIKGMRVGTLGGIMRDQITRDIYGITAKHIFNENCGYECSLVPTTCRFVNEQTGQYDVSIKVSDCFLGYFGHYNKLPGVSQCALDIAAIPITSDRNIEQYMDNLNDIQIYRGDIKKKDVQQNGSVSGKIQGKIIVEKLHMFYKGRFLGNECFKVAADNICFAQIGDSGAFVYDNSYGYGVVFVVESECPPMPVTGEVYRGIAWCTRLSHGIDMLRNEAGITLDFPCVFKDFAVELRYIGDTFNGNCKTVVMDIGRQLRELGDKIDCN